MRSKARGRGLFYGWFILATGFFVLFVSTGARNGFGVFIVPMEDTFGWDRGTTSIAIAAGWLINGVTQPFLGRLLDRYGGRRVISASLAALGIGTILLTWTSGFWYLLVVYGVIMSIASGGTSLVTIHSVLARWFYRRRGAALSLSTAGASAGSLVMAPFATYLILLAGWQVSWFVLGTLVILLALPLALIIIKDDPEEIGEIPDGDPNPVKGVKRTRQVEARGPLEAARWKDSYKSLPMWQLTGAYFVCGMTTAIISAHYVPFAIDRGASPGAAALAFGLMSGLNVLGVLGAGALSDRFGRKNVLGATYAVRGLAYAMLLLAPGALGLWGFAVVAGVSWIASAPLTSSLTAEIYGLKNMGTLNGMVTFAHQMGGALSIYMGGLLYDVFGAYNVPFAIAGFMLVGASLSAFAIRERRYSSRYQPLLPQPAAVPAGDAN